MTEVQWLLEHSEVTPADPEFVWRYWTDVSHWDDPPARLVLEGPFETGSRGTTLFPDREPFVWLLRDVEPGRGYAIVSDLGGAELVCEWSFAPSPGGGTRLTQRMGLAGPNAARHAEGVRKAFAATLAPGMQRIARLLAEAGDRA
jgi:hypothetical protein